MKLQNISSEIYFEVRNSAIYTSNYFRLSIWTLKNKNTQKILFKKFKLLNACFKIMCNTDLSLYIFCFVIIYYR